MPFLYHMLRTMTSPRAGARGAVTVMVLVMLVLFATIFSASLRIIARQSHQTTDQEQEEVSFSLADTGVSYMEWLLNTTYQPGNVKKTPPELADNPVLISKLACGVPISLDSEQTTGTFYVDMDMQPATDTDMHIRAYGTDAAEKVCQTVDAHIQKFSTAPPDNRVYYRTIDWRHLTGYPCPPPEFKALCGTGGQPPAPTLLPPSNLSHVDTATTENSITWTWADNSDNEDGFEIYDETGQNLIATIPADTEEADTESHVETNLAPDTSYSRQVRAYIVEGDQKSAFSNIDSETTPPAAPSNFDHTNVTQSTITWTWQDNASNEDGFKLYDAAATDPDADPPIATITNGTTYPETSLQSSTEYSRKVAAYNNSTGSSSFSNIDSATTQLAPPSAPTDLGKTASSQNSITWMWNDNSANETGFKMYDQSGNLKGTMAANATTFPEGGLQPGTEYTRMIAAYNTAGSNSSLPATARTDSPSQQPPVDCSPFFQIRFPGRNAAFTSNVTATWSAPTGNPGSGSGLNFLTKYPARGLKTVTASADGQSDECYVLVVIGSQDRD